MKVLMFGPGYGHNATGFIDLFKSNSKHDYTYICKGSTNWRSSGNLKILTYDKSFTTEIKNTLKEKSLIWVHGGYDIKQLLAIIHHKHKDSFFSINLWGEQVAKMSMQRSLKGLVYKYIFNKANLLHCNWYGVYDLIKDQYLNAKVHPWGLVSNFFVSEEQELSDYASNFIKDLPENKFKFFYPKSILSVSGQVEVIEACKILKKELGETFVVYLWCGNASDEIMKARCMKLIKDYGLVDVVRMVEHPYLSFFDIKKIWSKVDCGLQIAKSDQLSTSFLEPQYLEKELIATSIPPYVTYNCNYSLKLDLVAIDILEIAGAMKKQILKQSETKQAELQLRKKIISEEFNFSNNIMEFINNINLA